MKTAMGIPIPSPPEDAQSSAAPSQDSQADAPPQGTNSPPIRIYSGDSFFEWVMNTGQFNPTTDE